MRGEGERELRGYLLPALTPGEFIITPPPRSTELPRKRVPYPSGGLVAHDHAVTTPRGAARRNTGTTRARRVHRAV